MLEYNLHFIRDKDKREVDFLVVKNNHPWILIEAKLSVSKSVSSNLIYFKEKLKIPFAFQVVSDMEFIEADCFQNNTPTIVPYQTLLNQLV